MTIAYIGMGGNIGDRQAYIEKALDMLAQHPNITLARVASLFETAPWGNIDQAWFLNTVAELDTSLAPKQLLEVLLNIEKSLKRVREQKWGPRTIDLDLLLYGQEKIDLPDLQVPHPHLSERAFVLAPLTELCPEMVLPQGKIKELAARVLAVQEICRLAN